MGAWVNQIFKAGQANKGGVVRRERYYVDQYASMVELITECRKRGFHLIETGDQVVILCNEGAIQIHC